MVRRANTRDFITVMGGSPSQNKEAVSQEIKNLEPGKTPEDVIHDPYVLEFLWVNCPRLRFKA